MGMTGDILTLGQRATARAGAVVRRVLLGHAERVVDDAARRWPVKSGRSRAALAAKPTTDGAQVVNAIGYATSIISGGVDPWEAYVVEPAKDMDAAALARELVSDLVASHGR